MRSGIPASGYILLSRFILPLSTLQTVFFTFRAFHAFPLTGIDLSLHHFLGQIHILIK